MTGKEVGREQDGGKPLAKGRAGSGRYLAAANALFDNAWQHPPPSLPPSCPQVSVDGRPSSGVTVQAGGGGTTTPSSGSGHDRDRTTVVGGGGGTGGGAGGVQTVDDLLEPPPRKGCAPCGCTIS